MKLSEEDKAFWLLAGQDAEEEKSVSSAILTMKSGRAVKITTELFQNLISRFEEFCCYNCFKGLNTIYVPYVTEDEKPYWLCRLRYVPNEVYCKILDLE